MGLLHVLWSFNFISLKFTLRWGNKVCGVGDMLNWLSIAGAQVILDRVSWRISFRAVAPSMVVGGFVVMVRRARRFRRGDSVRNFHSYIFSPFSSRWALWCLKLIRIFSLNSTKSIRFLSITFNLSKMYFSWNLLSYLQVCCLCGKNDLNWMK